MSLIGRIKGGLAGLMAPAARPVTGLRVRASAGGGAVVSTGLAYDADSGTSQELGGWAPALGHPDSDVSAYRDRRVGRTRDVVRNDGWANGAISRIADNTVGAAFRPVSMPDWQALARIGGSQFDATWANEFATVVDSEWRAWGEGPGYWCHAGRSLTIGQLFRLAMIHEIVDGESLAVNLWRPDEVAPGFASYATTVQLVDPDRLSNPWAAPDAENMRGGVEIDAYGAPVAYHLRRAHPDDALALTDAMVWDRLPRLTEWGRPLTVHNFKADRAGQHRGVGLLTPVLAKLKMLGRYETAELQQAVFRAMIRTVIESPYDPDQVQEALNDTGELSAYQQMRADFHEARPLMMGGSRVPNLMTGEKVVTIDPKLDGGDQAEFTRSMLRAVASALGLTAEQITQDYSTTNYSSLRAATLEAYRTTLRVRHDFAAGFANPIRLALLEEIVERNPGIMPRNAPDFAEITATISRCKWLGPGRGWVDPVKEREGAMIGMAAGLTTLEQECADTVGVDWRESLGQRAVEIALIKKLNLPMPEWTGANAKSDASAAAPAADDARAAA